MSEPETHMAMAWDHSSHLDISIKNYLPSVGLPGQAGFTLHPNPTAPPSLPSYIYSLHTAPPTQATGTIFMIHECRHKIRNSLTIVSPF